MQNRESQTEALVQIVGPERDRHPPEVVAAARHEITRRLGGTRKRALCRIRIRGALCVLAGLTVVGTAVASVAARMGSVAASAAVCVTAGLLGLPFIAVGVAILRGRYSARAGRRSIRLVRPSDLAVLQAEPHLEELLDVIAQSRKSGAPEEVTAAERELTERLAAARRDIPRRLRRWGMTAIAVGLLYGLPGVAALVADLEVVTLHEGALGRVEVWAGRVGWAVIACGSWGLVAGGLGLRRRREWGRRTLLGVLWVWLVTGLAMVSVLSALAFAAGGPESLALAATTPLSGLICFGLLWGLIRALSQLQVREVCIGRATTADEFAAYHGPVARTQRVRRARRRVLAVICAAIAFGVGLGVCVLLRARRQGLVEEVTHAASEGDIQHLRELLDDHPRLVNARCEGETPLHVAAKTARADAVRLLLSSGADVDALNDWGYTPLHWTSWDGAEVTELLLANGADPNASDHQGRTPLHVAAAHWEGRYEGDAESGEPRKFVMLADGSALVELLLAGGAGVGVVDAEGRTALHTSASGKVTEVLLAHGADPAARTHSGSTALHEAAYEERLDVAQVLIRWGADVNARDSAGRAPLYRAVTYHAYHAQYGPDGQLTGTVEVRGRRSMAEFLLANGAAVNSRDNAGRTVLHEVAERGWLGWTEFLLASGADANARDESSQTPLGLAESGGHEDVAELLRQHGAVE